MYEIYQPLKAKEVPKEMKCKAKWLRTLKEYQLYCPDCDMYTMKVTPGGEPTLPATLAARHIWRYHTERM